jgi:hypothetical protein
MRWIKVSLYTLAGAVMLAPLPVLARQGQPSSLDPGSTSTSTSTSASPTQLDCGQPRFVDFARGSRRLSPQAKGQLDEVALWAKDDTGNSVRLRGLTDQSGSAVANAKLSARRADAVKGYLTQQGVDPMRIASVGHDEMVTRDELHDRRAVEVTTCRAKPAVAVAEPALPAAPAEPLSVPPPPAPIPVAPAPPPPVIVTPTVVTPPPEEPTRPPSRIGVAAMVGGGVTGFVDEEVRNFTDPGGSWDARLTVGTQSPLALEAAYIGSAQNIDALGLDSDALLLGQGAEGTARLNLGRFAVQPYLFGGVGWMHYQLERTPSNTSSIRESDDVLNVPFGAGIGFRIARGVLLDLRATGRAAFDDDLMDVPYANTGKEARLHSWNAAGRLGVEF